MLKFVCGDVHFMVLYSLVALSEESDDLCRLRLGFTLVVAVSEFQANFVFQHPLVRKAKLQEKEKKKNEKARFNNL